MALIGNYSVFNKTPGKFTSGVTLSQTRANYGASSGMRCSFLHFGNLASYPDGYYPPYCWAMPQAVGGMSSFTSAVDTITPIANLAGGFNLQGSVNLSLSVSNAQLDQIVSLVCSALLSISNTNALLSASVSMQASSLLSVVTNANIGAIVDGLASSSVTISANAIISALAHMNAEAGGPTILSPEGLANAVWATQINSLRAEELISLLGAINIKLDEVYKIQGLDSSHPMTVTESGRVVGNVTQNFTGDGISTTTITRV